MLFVLGKARTRRHNVGTRSGIVLDPYRSTVFELLKGPFLLTFERPKLNAGLRAGVPLWEFGVIEDIKTSVNDK